MKTQADLHHTIPEYHTKRLILRGVTLADVPSYKKHFVDYEVIRNLSGAVPWPYPENGVESFLEDVILPHQGVDRWTWGIFLKSNPVEMIGGVDLWREGRPEHRGFWLGRQFWNKGYMTEAMYPIIDYAFHKLGFNALIFANAVGNIASRRIKEKTGCELIDLRPGSFVNPAFTEQEIWRLTPEAWENHKLLYPPDCDLNNG